MPQQEATITNTLGLHARPAYKIVQDAKRFSCDVIISNDSIRVNAKSIMGVLMLAAGQGTCLLIEAEGMQAEQALEELTELVKRKFDEE